VRAADVPDHKISAGEASFLFSDIRLSRQSALTKDGVPHFSAVVRNQFPVAVRNVRFAVDFQLSGGRTETITLQNTTFYANHTQELTFMFLPPYGFAPSEITGVNIRLVSGQMASSRPGMTYDGFIATSEACLGEYLRVSSRAGADVQGSLTELLDRGCGSFVLKPLVVRPIVSKTMPSGASIMHASFSSGARFEDNDTDAPVSGWVAATKVVRTTVIEWRPIGTLMASSTD
jgi:hypothetical protein